jgi:hypothetical protein
MFAPPAHAHDQRSARDTHAPASPAHAARDTHANANPVWRSLALGTSFPRTELAVSQPSDAHEREADRVAREVVASPAAAGPVAVQTTATAPFIQRQVTGEPTGALDVSKDDNWQHLYAGYLIDTADAVAYNLTVQQGGNPRVGAEVIPQAQNFTGAGLLMPYDKGPGWTEILQQLSISVATWQYRYLRNRDQIFKTDPSLKVAVDGKLTPDTVAAMKLNGLKPTKEEWAKRDRKEYEAVRDEEKFFRQRVAFNPGSAGTVRQAIVDMAASQVGKVFAADRGDDSKYGWERIARYYEQAYAGTKVKGVEQGPDAYFAGQRDKASGAPLPNKDLADIQKANTYLHDTDKENKKQITIKYREKHGPPMSASEKATLLAAEHVWNWSWCAIFAVWAVRAVTGRGLWQSSGPVGLGTAVMNDPKLERARRGDLLHIKDSPQNHHVILAQEVLPGSTKDTHITVVEGNLDAQEIAYSRRWTVADIDRYYPTVPDTPPPSEATPAATPAAQKPAQ